MKQILLVEDEVIIGSALAFSLRNAGYDVIYPVLSADEALPILKDSPVDLVLMDINIQGEPDGITVAEQMREQRKIPLIYISGLTDKATLKRAEKTDPFAFFNKPVDFFELSNSIMECLKD